MTQPTYEPAPDPPRRRRSLATWVMLLAVWTVGLLFWGLYVGLAIWLLYWFMT